jgi:hypothetical protein
LSEDAATEIETFGRVWATPAGVKLGPLDQIADPGARNYVLQIGDKRFHGFVVRRGEAAFGVVRARHRRLRRWALYWRASVALAGASRGRADRHGLRSPPKLACTETPRPVRGLWKPPP